MDLPTFRDLLAPAGRAALAAAVALHPTEAGYLAAFETLRKRHPPALAKAALEIALLRLKARGRFAHADQLFFTREALEQASGDTAARHRAARFAPYGTVLDLCCGVGADALVLAATGRAVDAVESDPLRLEMARANAAALGLADRVRVHAGDVLTMPLPPADAAFVDPSRREGERRVLDPESYWPPLGAVPARFPAGFPLAAKIAPGVARADLERYDAEAEFVSVGGELKECVLWFGPLRTTRRRATVLPDTLAHPASETEGEFRTLEAADPPYGPSPTEVGEYVFDPDAAVIRADLVGLLAERLDLAPVDHGVAFLTGDRAVATPFADCYRVEHAAPFHAAKLRDYLRECGVGRLTVLKRAVDLDVPDATRKLKLAGPHHRHLILVRTFGKTAGVVAERVS